jgi:uncharacterized protein (TIGR02001 family)
MEYFMSHSIAKIAALSALALSSVAFAQTAAPAAPEPDYTLSYNAGLVTDYRYRGISQSAKKPALQGGVDLAIKGGAYVGLWASTISWIKDSGAGLKGPVEADIYGGYKGAINDTFSYDVGALQYWYVNNNYKNVGSNANTFELYGAVTAGPATLKYSRSLTDLFGTTNSKGSGYLDLSATFDLGNGYSVVPHMGRQTIKNSMNYTDYALALNKDIDGLVLSATAVGTNKKNVFVLPGSGSKDLGGNSLVLGIKKNF